ncbi:MAG TPA: DUF1501 domain-containing protein [Bryobacteraceae bacterium]|nr:DUF1501 domain-containing protein [Bryobacteraceae bacterium]
MTIREQTRRQFFQHAAGLSIGGAALASLLHAETSSPYTGLHFPAKAKRVIYLYMAGGPSQVDLFDYKPQLRQLDGQPIPESFIQGERFAFIKGVPKILASPHSFKQYGQSGATISNLLPGLQSIADDVTFIKSMHTTQFNHSPAQILLSTGFQIPGRPSFGSWLTYGIGSDSKDLPAFVVLLSGSSQPDGGTACWSSGFLPTVHQGVPFRKQGDPILSVSNPEGMSAATQRRSLDVINKLNRVELGDVNDPEISTRIAAYELAYKMQTSVPDLQDFSKEPESIHKMYGTTPGQPSFANNCLLARRLVERGVRFVQLFHRDWDTHGANLGDDIVNKLPAVCRETDGPAAALVKDLKQRGMLDDTLIIWAGEFGRTPVNEGRGGVKFLGRDHHPKAFTVWLAGGGIKPGITYGATDEIGYNIADKPVAVHDLHATALRLLGIDHKRLTYRFQGRDFRLTDVAGEVIGPLVG